MIKQKTKTQLAFNISQREIKELYCPISSDESQIKEGWTLFLCHSLVLTNKKIA